MRAARFLDDAVFDALGSPIRRSILRLLFRRTQSVAELAAHLPVSRPAVSRHLRLLSEAGLVEHEESGTRNLYRLRQQGFEAARDDLGRFWDSALQRLKLAAENTRPGSGA